MAAVTLFALATGCLHEASQAEVTPSLSIHGNRIVDGHGKDVVLRGIHRAYIDDPHATGGEVSSDEIALATSGRSGSWHATVIRIPLGTAQWTGECPLLYARQASYRRNIDDLVKRVTDRGVVALLDLHVSTAGCTSIDRHAMPDAPITQHFWASVASHYADNPLVAFELYNEPHNVPDSTWLAGTTKAEPLDCPTSQPAGAIPPLCTAPVYRAVGMQELYDLVSAKAPHHLIVIDGPGWAANPSTKPVRGSFVYGFHPYTCSVPGASCDRTSKAHANLPLLNRWVAVARRQPVLATELGWPTYGPAGYVEGASYYRETLAFLEKRHWGFVAFAFDGGSTSGFSMVTDTGSYAPNSTAKPVFDLLRSR
jgi:hypothetical protein